MARDVLVAPEEYAGANRHSGRRVGFVRRTGTSDSGPPSRRCWSNPLDGRSIRRSRPPAGTGDNKDTPDGGCVLPACALLSSCYASWRRFGAPLASVPLRRVSGMSRTLLLWAPVALAVMLACGTMLLTAGKHAAATAVPAGF